MMKRLGATTLAVAIGGIISAGAAMAELRPSVHRPALVEVGDPTMVDRSALRKEMERISDLKDHVARHGWPDYAEVQPVIAEEPFGDYEVRIYYMLRQREFDFASVDAAPWVKDFGIKRYEGPIPTETLGRLLTAEPLSAPAVIEPETPPPPPAAAAPASEPLAEAEPVAAEAAPAELAPAAGAPAAPAGGDGQAVPFTEQPAPAQ
jgi:hypothetical protein